MERMPVFIKIDEYNDVLNLMDAISKKIEEAKNSLLKVHDLKNEEDHQLEMWQNTLTDVEKKVDFINHSLNQPEEM
jgi:tetrahydromethanopterin S-methyltransferase subunit G